ncbi:MAG: hypothetical protein AAGI71_11185 [Bacteroidota bacterium]
MHTYNLHGITLGFACTDGPLRDLVDDTMAYKGAVLMPGGTPEVILDLAPAAEGITVPAEAARITTHEHDIDILHTGATYFLTYGEDTVVRIDAEDHRATFVWGPDFRGPLPRHEAAIAFYLIIITLVILVRYRGWYALHAAALEHDGVGVLLSAVSGSGKTTTTLNLIRAGWRYATDDTVLMRPTEGGLVEVISYRKAFSLTDETLALFPELSGRSWPRPPGLRPKWRVSVEAGFPGQFVPHLIPRFVVVPTIEPEAPSRVEPMPSREALLYLISQTGLQLTPDRALNARHMEAMGVLVRQCTCLRLKAGPDLLEDPARTAVLLREAMSVQSQEAS